MWPCWFAIACIDQNLLKNIKWYFYFAIGSFLMRSAGCIIIDIIDIKLDANVPRTQNRPLVTGKISKKEAVI